MSIDAEIAARVQRFLAQLQVLVLKMAREAVQTALEGVPGTLPPQTAPAVPTRAATPTRPALPPKRRPKPTSPPRASVRSPTRAGSAAPEPESQPPPGAAVTAHVEPAPAPPAAAASPTSERESRVLAAVADLIRATATEVAEHTGLPNGTVTITLRALAARGQLLRKETARGLEYSVPPGRA